MLTGKELGSAIDKAIKLKGVKKSEVAKEFGIKPPSVTSWIQTGRVAKEHLGKLIEYFSDVVQPSHFGMDSIASIKGNDIAPGPALKFWSSKDPLPDDEFIHVPFYKDVKFAGGCGSMELEDTNGFTLPFGRATLHRAGVQANMVFCCTAVNGSMAPVISEGATMAVDKSQTAIRDGKIYAIEHGGMGRFKMLYRMPNEKVKLRSFNETEYPEEIINLNDIKILGRVFWWAVMD